MPKLYAQDDIIVDGDGGFEYELRGVAGEGGPSEHSHFLAQNRGGLTDVVTPITTLSSNIQFTTIRTTLLITLTLRLRGA